MSAYLWSETIVFVLVKHATRAPSPCHPSEAKSKVNVLLKPPFLSLPSHENTHDQEPCSPYNTQTHTHTYPVPVPKHTNTCTHVHMLGRAIMASHPVCPGHIKAKSL